MERLPLLFAVSIAIVLLAVTQSLAATQGLRQKRTSFFVGDAETGTLAPWPDLHDANDLSAIRSPAAQGNYGYRFYVYHGQHSSSVDGQLSYLERDKGDPWEQEGTDTWYRWRYAFPSGTSSAFPGKFTPPNDSSAWNMILEWHEPGGFGYSPYLGVCSWCRGRGHPLMLRWVGGTTANPVAVWAYDTQPLRYDHWYDMLLHVHWSSDPSKGFVQWWVDNRKVFPTPSGNDIYGKPLPSRFPTWWQANSVTQPGWLMFGHYRKDAPWADTTYGDDFRIGPSRASVGGERRSAGRRKRRSLPPLDSSNVAAHG